jgi:two-component system sensor histidine kinase UhpB
VTIELTVELGAVQLQSDVALTLYRAAQEGMTNALRHGQAHRLDLDVSAHADEVRLELRDDGRGLPVAGTQRAGHHGLRWLTERVEGLHGDLTLEAVPTHGVRLSVHIPLPARQPQ